MTAPVPRQKSDRPSRQLAYDVVIRRAAPWRLNDHFLLRFETGHGVEPAAADDADLCLHWMATNKH